MHLRSSLTLRRRRLVPAALVLAASVSLVHAAPSHAAGQYGVYACKSPGLEPMPTADAYGGWAPFTSASDDSHKTVDRCTWTGQGLSMSLDGGTATVPIGSSSGWRWTSPPGTTIKAFNMRYSAYTRPWDGRNEGIFHLVGDRSGIMLRNEGAGTIQWAYFGRDDLRNDTTITALVTCDAPNSAFPACPAGANANAEVLASSFLLADDTGPTAGATAGSAKETTWKATKSLNYTGADVGGGVARLHMYVDGVLKVDKIIDDNGGRCIPASTNPDYWMFPSPRPCPNSVSAFHAIDTTTIPDGPHTIAFTLLDAAAHEAVLESGEERKIVANYPPVNTAPPAFVSAQRAAQPRTGDQLAVANNGQWSGPSLTYAAGWEQCDASGTECTQIPGATGLSYTTTAADIGRRLRYSVTATNAADSVTTRTPLTGIVTAQENSVEAPVAKPADGVNGAIGANGANGANGSGGGSGAMVVLPGLPTNTDTRAEHRFVGRVAGEPIGTSCPQDRASLIVEHVSGGQMKLGFGKTGVAQVQLTCTISGKAIADAKLQIATQVGMRPAVASDVTTDGAGHAVLRLAAGASRGITVGYRMYADDPIARATATLKVLVASRLTIKANRKLVRNGRAVTLRAKLAGGHVPSRGVTLAVQWRDGRRWRPFAQVKTTRTGTVSYGYRFTRTNRKVTYRLRMQVIKGQVDYPFTASASKPVRVTVAP